MMRQWAGFAVAGVIVATTATAQVRPQPGTGDARLQSVDYRRDQVVEIVGALGYLITIALAPDERVQSIALGDSTAWQVTPSKVGDRLFVKPLVAGVDTNMSVVTDARSYNFDLRAGGGAGSDAAYTIRFRYPTPVDGGIQLDALVASPSARAYRLGGARALRPARIADDGTHTFVEWPADAPLPASYALGSDGHEMLLNGAMRGGVYVIDSINMHLIFRLDDATARADRLPLRKVRRR